MPINVLDSKFIKDETPFNILIYGDGGSGKTYLASTAAQVECMRDVLFLDLDKGSITVADMPHVSVTRPEDWDGLRDIANVLEEEDHPYRTIVIDSLTEAQDMCSAFVLKDTDAIVPEIKHYNIILTRMKQLVRRYRNLCFERNYNLILTAGFRSDKDTRKGSVQVLPALTPAVAKAICGIVDTVGLLEFDDETEERQLLLVSRPNVQCKIRQTPDAPPAPDDLLEPTIGKLYTLIKNIKEG